MEITKQYPDDLDADTAYALLKAVVAEAGKDYVYRAPLDSNCRYEHDGKPSCGVGRALARYGVPLATLMEWDSRPGGSAIYTIRADWLTYAARDVLQGFQGKQDQSLPWSRALAGAKRVLESVKAGVQ